MNTKSILGEELYDVYQGGEFWNDEPEPIRGNKPLDLALEASLIGNFKKGREILDNIILKEPNNNRAKFNLGIYEMMAGNNVRGHKYLDFGREEYVFGNRFLETDKPMWQKERNATVLLNLEGGLGDQIHGIRYVKNIIEYGNRVIVCGASELASLLHRVNGVSAYVHHGNSARDIHFDFWTPSMSLPVILDLEFSDLCGESYIKNFKTGNKIGVKWAGNPKFEHEQHRLFNEKLMWDAVEGFDCISLQKEGLTGPEWMEKPSLETWENTHEAISQCDLVVTSCTSIAHLSGAMGVKTFVVVPILPYYMWALPGNISPHYDNVTLFRQTEYGNWNEPLLKLKKRNS